jgi:hypothetical protein
MADRFDLEQQILECWRITDDITDLEKHGASVTDMVSLASVYEYKFQKLWNTFEKLVEEKQFKNRYD